MMGFLLVQMYHNVGAGCISAHHEMHIHARKTLQLIFTLVNRYLRPSNIINNIKNNSTLCNNITQSLLAAQEQLTARWRCCYDRCAAAAKQIVKISKHSWGQHCRDSVHPFSVASHPPGGHRCTGWEDQARQGAPSVGCRAIHTYVHSNLVSFHIRQTL